MRPLLVLLCAASAFAAPFSLEQILGSAFPSELTAAPVGARVAWVSDARGVRNVWVAEGPEWRGRAVTTYKDDDGQELSSLTWTPDGKSVVYVRGGAANRAGEIPNPMHRVEGAEQAVWIVGAQGGQPVKLGEGSAPEVSPKGDRVAWLKGGAVWSSAPGGGGAKQWFKTRGRVSYLRFSPDGGRVAFVSSRGDHSFVGLFDGEQVRFLDPGVDVDGGPIWSPDGKRVAFVRVPARRERFAFGPVREAEPWSIRVVDAATGQGREVWRARPGRGSALFFQLAVFLWGAGDRLVFSWEREGWAHLYTLAAGGGDESALTKGAFEVESAVLSADGTQVYYQANDGDINRRHLFRVGVKGGKPELLTPGRGVEWSAQPAADGSAVAFLRSDGVRPAHPAVRLPGGEVRPLQAGSIPSDFPLAELVEPEAVTYPAADGMTIHGQLFLPKGAKAGDRRPAAIFLHGGSRRQMLLGWHYSPYYHNAYALNQYLASRGYVVLSVNYRSGIGYGMEFREALQYGATGASEFQDVLGAGLYLRSRPEVDGKKIALWGGSYGGYLTAMGLSRASELFAAGVDIHGVHDWNEVIRNFVPAYDSLKRAAAAKLAFDSSPLASVDGWRSPVLLIHGDDDRNVPFSETTSLVEELRKRGVPHELLVFPDEVHSFLRHESWVRAFRAAEGFLERHLRSQ
ncbi:MAG: prolyl oligopeptidase family serine peptidase [Bryobacteraceae bacterium]|nr:prolyl oligopeptidase family serine peptidase [Bryobacteraceae bacterium]